MPRVLIAPDKFKGSLTAGAVAAAVASGIRRARPNVDITTMPVADGGEGTAEAALAAGFDRVDVTGRGPTGEPVDTFYARRGSTAVIELANTCGISRLPRQELAPLAASTHGLGDVIRAALDAGCRKLVIGLGGSASTDGGAGMLAALGATLLDSKGTELAGGALGQLADLCLDGLHPALARAELVVACDVDNPLLGPRGPAAVYGPQKGATRTQVQKLDRWLNRWAELVTHITGADHRHLAGTGAAGGTGFAAVAVLDAELVPGIDVILNLLGFDEAMTDVDLVVTGEGSLDEQSLHGKTPIGVTRAAHARGLPTVAVCGRRSIPDNRLEAYGIRATYALTDIEPNAARCIQDAPLLLATIGTRIAATYF